MPPLNEGTLLYMPSTLPGISQTEAQRILQVQDRLIRTVPEVERVFGKAGRADTATDPAPFSMMETVIVLKPEDQWREKPRWFSSWAPDWLKAVLRPFWRDRITQEEIVADLDRAVRLPGHPQRLDHAHQGAAWTCCPPASAPPWASRSTARTWRPSRRWPWRPSPSCPGCRAPAAPSPSARPRATSWTSS